MSHVEEWVFRYVSEQGGATSGRIRDACPYGIRATTAAITALVDQGRLVRSGHTIAPAQFAEEQRSEIESNRVKSTQKSSQIDANRDRPLHVVRAEGSVNEVDQSRAFGSADQPASKPNGAKPKPDDTTEHWWVCCSWYDPLGQLTCHGQDGHPTYIHCKNQDHAGVIARQHQRDVFHRGKPDQPVTSGVVSDICRSTGRQGRKSFVVRIGEYPW